VEVSLIRARLLQGRTQIPGTPAGRCSQPAGTWAQCTEKSRIVSTYSLSFAGRSESHPAGRINGGLRYSSLTVNTAAGAPFPRVTFRPVSCRAPVILRVKLPASSLAVFHTA
jgi:hypothetical protein